MTTALRRKGFIVNHKRVYSLMKNLGIKSTIRNKRKYYGRKGSSIFNNLLKRNFKSSVALKKLVTDITYIPYKDSFLYLSVIQDLYNNEIISYSISDKNDLELVFDTIHKLPELENAILHSDQGFQYTHKKYKAKLDQLGIRGSHSRVGNCLDNACIESFFSHLKAEAFQKNVILEKDEICAKIIEYIYFYNNERFQIRLKNLSPIEYREQLVA